MEPVSAAEALGTERGGRDEARDREPHEDRTRPRRRPRPEATAYLRSSPACLPRKARALRAFRRRVPPESGRGVSVAELGQERSGLALDVGELLGRQVAAPAAERAAVGTGEGARDRSGIRADVRGHEAARRGRVRDEILVAEYDRPLVRPA